MTPRRSISTFANKVLILPRRLCSGGANKGPLGTNLATSRGSVHWTSGSDC